MISYLGNKHWNEISRTELLFTSHLYEMIRKDIKKFIRFLNTKEGFHLDEELEWEVSFEVCFYRDFLQSYNMYESHIQEYKPKRTFDLCLFSEKSIVIIEAKAQQCFDDKKDGEAFSEDKILVKQIVRNIANKNIDVHVVALASQKCLNDMGCYGRTLLLNSIDKKITWSEMDVLYR